ncbi:MAG: hypothetical protein KGO81_13985 [Bacteroidota bacterium]|nr:hypothetical protein [Bacteroidota bacterium]
MQLVVSKFMYTFYVLLLGCLCVFSPTAQPAFYMQSSLQRYILQHDQTHVAVASNREHSCIQNSPGEIRWLHFSLYKPSCHPVRLRSHTCLGEAICLKNTIHSKHFTLPVYRKFYTPAATTFNLKNTTDKFISENEEEEEETGSLRRNGDADNYFTASFAVSSHQYFCHYIKTCLSSLKHFNCTPSNKHIVLCVILI